MWVLYTGSSDWDVQMNWLSSATLGLQMVGLILMFIVFLVRCEGFPVRPLPVEVSLSVQALVAAAVSREVSLPNFFNPKASACPAAQLLPGAFAFQPQFSWCEGIPKTRSTKRADESGEKSTSCFAEQALRLVFGAARRYLDLAELGNILFT